jgi:hypothetical protein
LGDLYKKVNGSWGIPIRNFKGADGADGANGIFSEIASQSEAEAGTDNVKGMTAERVAQAIKTQNYDVWEYALSDETSDLTLGTKLTTRARSAVKIREIRTSLTVSNPYTSVVLDINVSGVSIFATRISIDVNEKTSVTAADPYVLTSTPFDIADDAEISFDVTTVGTGAKGLKVSLLVERQ